MSNNLTAVAENPEIVHPSPFVASASEKRVSISVPQTTRHTINAEHARGVCVTLQFATKKDRDYLIESIVKWSSRGMPPTQASNRADQEHKEIAEVVGRKFMLYLPKAPSSQNVEHLQDQLQISFAFERQQDVRGLISALRRWAQKDTPTGINRSSVEVQALHANSRFRSPIIRQAPTKAEIKAWRYRVGLSQQQAFGLTYHGSIDVKKVFTAWQRYERGDRTMSPQDWLWFLLHTNQLDAYLLETYGEKLEQTLGV